MGRLKTAVILLSLLLAVLLLAIVGLEVGPTGTIPLSEVLSALKGEQTAVSAIVRYRAMRTLAALILGAGLGASGLTLQYALRNPMADPYLLGVSTGAAFGVVLLFTVVPTPHPVIVYFFSMLWGIISFLIVIGVGAYMGAGPTSLIVAGVSVNYGFFGLIVLLLTKTPEAQRFSFTWLFGTVAYATSRTVLITAIIVVISILLMLLMSGKMYTLILGDEVSLSMGVNVVYLRLASVAVASVAGAALVALAGPVGFIGLAAPWAIRLALGSRYLDALIGSILLGGVAAITSDLAVRVIGGGEIPLTAVTALFGAPILFYLSRKTGW